MISHDEMRSQMADEVEPTACLRCDADITEDGRGSTGGECHVCRYRMAAAHGADEKVKAKILLALAWDAQDLKRDALERLLEDLFEAGARTGGEKERSFLKRVARDVADEARGR